jgi:hypothetical protein
MSSRSMNSFAFAALVAIALLCTSRDAPALDLGVQVIGTSQVGFTSRVRLGHIVTARSYMISVAAGGTLRVTCPSSYTGTIEGQNALAQTGWPQNVLSVEVPPGWLPAERELPGFNNVPGGTSLMCAYVWTASAKEAMYSLGAGGTGIPIGGDVHTKSDTVTFEMYKPGNNNGEDRGGCLPP